MTALAFLLLIAVLVAVAGVLISLSRLKKHGRKMNQLIKNCGVEFNEQATGRERMEKQHALINTAESSEAISKYNSDIAIYLVWYRILILVSIIMFVMIFFVDLKA